MGSAYFVDFSAEISVDYQLIIGVSSFQVYRGFEDST